MNRPTPRRRLDGLTRFAFAGVAMLAGAANAAASTNPTYRVTTNLGSFDITLYEQAAPGTVANWIGYVDRGDWENMFFHRSEPGFVIQGGGFTYTDETLAIPITTQPPIANEFGVSNTRSTLAMAKLGGDPDSATSQWFVNVGNNASNLDNQNGGFTVFGRVVGDGMQTVDAINALTRFNLNPPEGGPYGSVPLTGISGQGFNERLIFTESIVELSVLAGDFDHSGAVDQGDLNLVLSNWGQTASSLDVGLYGFGPGPVDQTALNAVISNWGTSAQPNLTLVDVPEPAAGLALLAAGGAALARRRPVAATR
ncbi:MAG: peptidylprolyl isomerase [Planctomycetota bacterium]